MANPLDVGLLDSLSIIFSMILVFAIVYGILMKAKAFGDNNGLHALVALVSALFLAFAPGVNRVIVTMVPWFILMFIFLLLLLQFYSFMGVKESYLFESFKKDKSISTWFLVVGFIILIASLGSVYFTSSNSTTGTTAVADMNQDGFTPTADVGATGTGAFFATLFHPKILGAIMVMLIGTFTIMLLASGGSTKG
ncbi:MAG: hypothetical protein GXP63_05900 [DPANN group archaeon]|nr:hypothetical protein [DPANN group archaeon]